MNNNYHNKGNTATTTTTKQFELKASVDASKDNIFIIIIRVTRLGDLWGITSDKFSCESSTTNFGDFLDYFGNTTLKKILLLILLGNFWGILGYFLFQRLVTLIIMIHRQTKTSFHRDYYWSSLYVWIKPEEETPDLRFDENFDAIIYLSDWEIGLSLKDVASR